MNKTENIHFDNAKICIPTSSGGRRPISVKETENFYESELKLLYQVKPGLTGYWQVYGRGNITFESGERQKLELEYLSKRGLWFDLKLIFLTIPAVLKHEGAK